LHSFDKVKELIGLGDRKAREIIPQFLQTLDFINTPEKGKTLWKLLFGNLKSNNYINLKKKCELAGFELKLDWYEYFNLLSEHQGRVEFLKVPVECEFGHISLRFIKSIGVGGCVDCYHESQRIDSKSVLMLASARDVKIDMSESEIQKSLDEARKKGDVHRAKLICIHNCDHKYIRTYESLLKGYGCKYCSKSKNENLVRLLAEIVFKNYVDKFRSGVSMLEIFPHLEGEIHPNMHIDIYANFEIDGKTIHLGIEYNGEQHYSFRDYVYIVSGKHIKDLDIQILDELYQDFLDQKARDKFKFEEFKKFNEQGYYLIVVPYSIPKQDRQEYIINEFLRQTDIELPKSSLIDWKKLWS